MENNVRWADELTWEEFRDLLKETDVGIQPVGSIEQHGPHAPLGLDNFVASEIARRIASKVKCLLMPPIKMTHSTTRADTSSWPGTISISPETMISLYSEAGVELARHGVRRLLFVNAHYNNSPLLDIASFNIWKKSGCAVGILEWFSAARKEVSRHTKSPPHADEVETSLLLASERADLVSLEKAVPNVIAFPPYGDERELWDLGIGDRITYAQDEHYLGHSGNWGDPRKADRKIGEEVIEATVDAGVKMIEALRKHVRTIDDEEKARHLNP